MSRPKPGIRRRPARRWLLALLGAALLLLAALAYSLWEYGAIRVTHLSLEADDPRLAGIKIVFAADFQYDLHKGRPESLQAGTLERAVNTIMAQEADLILLGGDYQTYPANYSLVTPWLARLEAPLGVYGVFGNHDSGAEAALAQALPGIRFLGNESVRVEYGGAVIELWGAEDLWHGDPRLTAGREGADMSILLTHNPDFFERLSSAERAGLDLTLAGHTHAGQVTFFGWRAFPPAFKVSDYGEKYRYGEKDYDGRVYITSGLGGAVFHLPIRFGARPEIVVIQG